MSTERTTYLLTGALNGTLTSAEREELFELAQTADRDALIELMTEQIAQLPTPATDISLDTATAAVSRILSLDKSAERPADIVAHRVHFLKTAWVRYAAAIIILFGIGAYLYVNNQKEKPSVTQTSPVPVQNDVAPGGNKAILTLADGSTIILDSVASGKIAEQGAATIMKTADDRIEYQKGGRGGGPITYNTMTTPRGGQYQLTLPDGSQVWLNAASSISYPTAFSGKERHVSITGEVYFEVEHDLRQPFRVTAGEETVEVLGTHFNINAYPEEPSIKTTLLEGSIRLKTVHTSIMLKPGQQGQLADQKLSLAVNPDLEQVMAWKNGYFNFKGADLKTVMRQVERWYDVKVVYEEQPGDMTFSGEIQRNLNLSDLLEGLRKTDIHFRIQGRQLIITR